MAFYSILPESWSFVEIWLARIFLLLAVASIGPLLMFFVYDFFLYIWRSTTYELPYIGGRARGRLHPRVPTIRDAVERQRTGESHDTRQKTDRDTMRAVKE